MQEAENVLLSLLSKSLFGDLKNTAVSDEVLTEARLQAVSTLISSDECQITANNMIVNAAHAELTRVLKDVPFVTIKGYASAYYYQEPLKRVMGDVDLYADPQNYERVVAKLADNGFCKKTKSHDRHETFIKNGVLFELHHSLKGLRDDVGKNGGAEEIGTALESFMNDLIPTARKVNTPQGEVIIPDDYHHGVIMLMHVAGHLLESGGIGLRHLCDWAAYVDKVPFEIFQPRLEGMGLWRFARQLTALCTRYLGLREMPWAGQWDEEFLEELMEDVLKAGNFGQKNGGRILNVQMASADKFYDPFVMKVNRQYPRMKSAWLFPIKALMFVAHYLVTQIRSHKKLNYSFFKEGRQRKKLYDQFCLYQVNDKKG